MHAMQTRLSMKRQSLAKWRDRYTKSEYPSRMVANLVGADIINVRLAQRAPELFQRGMSTPLPMEQAMGGAVSVSRTIHQEVAPLVDKRTKGQVSTLEPEYSEGTYSALITAAGLGSRGDSAQVEKIEYNWVYSALSTDLMEFWISFGLAGMGKERAFREAFYFAQSDANLTSADNIRGTFHGLSVAVLSAPGAYREMPPLW